MPRSRSLPLLLALALAPPVVGRASEPTIPELEAKLRDVTGKERVTVLNKLALQTSSVSSERAVE